MTLRIAQIAPLAEFVPPRTYGGTERVCSWLTEELVRQGHEVTLFASSELVNLGYARAMLSDGIATSRCAQSRASSVAHAGPRAQARRKL